MAEHHRIRKRHIKVKLSETEFDMLTEKAKFTNKTKSEFIRRMIVDGAVISHQPFDLKAVCYELNRIGNNINQIAYQANVRKNVSSEEIKNLKEAYENLLDLYVEKVLRE